MFDIEKSYSVLVWDMPVAVWDNEADDYIRNDDNTVKLFNADNFDYSYICEDIDVDQLQERDKGQDYE
jgi:hypothetical protein